MEDTPEQSSEIEIVNAVPVEIPKPEAEAEAEGKVSSAQVKSAARALGLTTFKVHSPVHGFRAKGTIGKYLRQLGIVDIGRGQLAIAESNIIDTMRQIEDAIAATANSETKLGLINLKVALNKQLIDIGQSNIKGTAAGGNGVVSQPAPKVGFPLGQAIQVNITPGNNSAKAGKK